MKKAREKGVMTTVDVFAGSAEDLPDVAAVLPWTDYFMPSEDEARALSGRTDLDDMARFCLPAFDIAVKCTCGCGDAFNAGFAVGLCRGFDMEATVRLAQATSALNATGLGSQAGVVSFEHTPDFMTRTPTR